MDAIFLKLDNIKGESQVEGFEDQIEIMSYSHNVAMQVNNDVSLTERTSGRAHVGEMSLTKFVDLATPVLNEYCCSGRLIRTAVLTLCRNDGGKMRSLIVYTLTNALISQLSVSGGAGGNDVAELHENRMANHCREIRRRSTGVQNVSMGSGDGPDREMMMTPAIPVALFDRLLVEGISPHELVRRKLMCLFNSCAVAGGETLPPLLTRGMPEWHEVNVGDKRVLNWFCRELRAAILRYEPSINMLKVSVKDAHHQTLALSLEAMLQDESEPLRLEIAYSNGRWR